METKKVAKEYLQKDILRTIFQMWYSFYTTEIGKERKAAIEDMRFERDGWLAAHRALGDMAGTNRASRERG